MARLDVVQISFFKFLLEHLSQSGVKTNSLIKQAELQNFNLSNPNNYVPAKLMYKLLNGICEEIGYENFLPTFRQITSAQNQGDYGEFLLSGLNLLEVCTHSVRYNRQIFSAEEDTLEIDGNSFIMKIKVNGDLHGAANPLYDIFLGLLMDPALFDASGPNPIQEVYLPQAVVPEIPLLSEGGSDIKVFTDQDFVGIKLPTKELFRKVGMYDNIKPPSGSPLSYKQRIILLFDNYQKTVLPGVEKVSAYFDTSRKTIQRKLRSEGTSYKEVLDEWRFGKAIGLLENPNLNIKEISQTLGYNNAQNFSRAFKRWTRISPHDYRDQLI